LQPRNPRLGIALQFAHEAIDPLDEGNNFDQEIGSPLCAGLFGKRQAAQPRPLRHDIGVLRTQDGVRVDRHCALQYRFDQASIQCLRLGAHRCRNRTGCPGLLHFERQQIRLHAQGAGCVDGATAAGRLQAEHDGHHDHQGRQHHDHAQRGGHPQKGRAVPVF
jgi:hypothetical protein